MESYEETFLNKISAKSDARSVVLSKTKYDEIADRVSQLRGGLKREHKDYWLLQHYDILEIGGVRKLIYPLSGKNDSILYYVHMEELYAELKMIHERIGHKGRDCMLEEVHKKFKNIGRTEISAFLSLCEICEKKRSNKRKGIVVKPLIFKQMNSRAQLDLIDLQSQPDNDYKMIMVYQDHLTKFVQLRPLKSKRADEVASNLLDIFTTFGAPCVLQSDNGREFCNSIIESLRSMWPDLKIVHGKPRHSQSQGSVERANRDIEEMLYAWLADNKTNQWSHGLKFVQFQKNSSYHSGIKRSPYEAMFGIPAKIGLLNTAIPRELWSKISAEEDMEDVLTDMATYLENPTSRTHVPVASVDITKATVLGQCPSDFEETSLTLAEDLPSSIIPLEDDEVVTAVVEADGRVVRSEASQSYELGATVRIPVPDVDRCKTDARSVLARVISRTEDGFYSLGTKDGILPQLYARSQFTVSDSIFLTEEDIPQRSITLRSAATSASIKDGISHGQGYIRCNCSQKCVSNRCTCLKKKIKCSSKCHSGSSCCNK